MTLIFVMPIVAISLPSVTLPGIRTMDVTSSRAPLYGENSQAIILSENNWTEWSSSSGQSGIAMNYSSDGMSLSGSFPASNGPQAFSITRTLDVNVTTYPIMYMLIKVSASASYGIRFYSASSGSIVPLWTESDALDHRPGTGAPENIQLNIIHLMEVNTGRIFNTIGSVTVYVERGEYLQATNFSLQIDRFEFLDFPLTEASKSGSYHALYAGLNQVQTDSFSSLRSVQFHGRINASAGTEFVPYFVEGLSAYPGSVLSIETSPADLSITIPVTSQSARSFSDNLPIQTVAVVLVSASGTFAQVTVTSISLNYYSRTAQTSSPPTQRWSVLITDVFFLSRAARFGDGPILWSNSENENSKTAFVSAQLLLFGPDRRFSSARPKSSPEVAN